MWVILRVISENLLVKRKCCTNIINEKVEKLFTSILLNNRVDPEVFMICL